MAQGFRSAANQEGSGRHHPVHLTALALRSLSQVYDMNLSAARVLLQTQARAASAVGLPDWSGWFQSADERARRVFSAGAEQILNTAQRASEAASELQREVGRVVDTQTATVAQTLQQGLQELGTQTSEGLSQLVETAREQAEEAERAADEIGEQMRLAVVEGGKQMRRGREQMGQMIEETGDAGQEAGEEEQEERRPRRRKAA